MLRFFKHKHSFVLDTNTFDLEKFDLKNVSELSSFEYNVFEIGSLGFANKVVANFKEIKNNKWEVIIELPTKLYYFQLIPLLFFAIIIFMGNYTNQFTSLHNIIFSSILIIMYTVYQVEFIKKTKKFIEEYNIN